MPSARVFYDVNREKKHREGKAPCTCRTFVAAQFVVVVSYLNWYLGEAILRRQACGLILVYNHTRNLSFSS